MLFIMILALLCTHPAIDGTQIKSVSDGIYVLLGGRLIDGTGDNPVEDSAVVIQSDRILYAGPRSGMEIPDRAQIIDVSGMTVLPGLINAHSCYQPTKSELSDLARAGITTIRIIGADKEWLSSIEDLQADARYSRVISAGPILSAKNGYPEVPFGKSDGYLVTKSPKKAKKQVWKLLRDGFHQVGVVCETGTVFGEDTPTLSKDSVETAVNAARGYGSTVSAHITELDQLEKILDAGVADITHMIADRKIPAQLIRRMVEADLYSIPNLVEWKDLDTKLFKTAQKNVRSFVKAGGDIALGTGFAGSDSEFEIGIFEEEVSLLQNIKLKPMQIIMAATKHGAAVCDFDRQLGVLKTGKIADVIVVSGNPLNNIEALFDVQMVVHYGVFIRNDIDSVR